MRKAARTDGNQAEIVAALREAGASVEILAQCGKGVPDLLIGVDRVMLTHTNEQGEFTFGIRNVNLLAEVKDPSKPKADQKLTPDQERWHREWKGQVAVVYSVADALRLIGVE